MEFFSFDSGYLERLAARDAGVERHFHEYFSELIFIKLRSRQMPPHVIDDLKQETFVRVLDALRRGTIREPERVGAFVNSVCNNVLLEYGRQGSRMTFTDETPDMPDQRDSSEKELMLRERRAQVRDVLARMPEKNRQLLSAVFLEERPSDEVCQEFGVDRNYLRVLLYRARAQFRQVMEKKNQGGPKSNVRTRASAQ